MYNKKQNSWKQRKQKKTNFQKSFFSTRVLCLQMEYIVDNDLSGNISVREHKGNVATVEQKKNKHIQ